MTSNASQASGTKKEDDLFASTAAVLDEALEMLAWCRAHVEERGVSEAMRELENKLGYLAQALAWDMDGEAANATGAIRLAQGKTRKPTYAELHPFEYDWWNAH